MPSVAPSESPAFGWWWAVALALLAAAGAGAILLRNRRASDPSDDGDTILPPTDDNDAQPAPVANAPSMLAPAAPSPRASAGPARNQLEVAFRPTRAGLNLLSATVEGELELVNAGTENVADIRIDARLLGISASVERELADARGAVAKPMVPAFTLAPGERRQVRVVVALRRDALPELIAAGRPMFVPLVAVNVLYDGGEGQVAAAWAVGVERTDSAKLAPFWLDTPPRNVDAVAARPHGAMLVR